MVLVRKFHDVYVQRTSSSIISINDNYLFENFNNNNNNTLYKKKEFLQDHSTSYNKKKKPTVFLDNNKKEKFAPKFQCIRQPNTFDPNANLIIKNLEAHLTESDIIEKMRAYGDILSCKLVRDERTGESKCYSYLQYKDAGSAAEAIDKLNNT